ncbi:MAG: cache domain-containing protein [Candidatus Omnitrophica bacterium]|nr:cache domain-containing protein [Candidatus Omnitrophota bacterium]
MKNFKLRDRILLNFICVIILLAVFLSFGGYLVVKKYIVGRAQEHVNNYLRTVAAVYQEQFNRMAIAFSVKDITGTIKPIQDELKLDYIFRLNPGEAALSKSDIAKSALEQRKPIFATRIIEKEELRSLGLDPRDYQIDIRLTPRARPTKKETLDSFLALEYARPYLEGEGNVVSVLYGGRILNKSFDLVDEINQTVFEERMYEGKPIGTVTIFLDDVRITTNVLDPKGQRAIGTRVSESVYVKVVEQGKQWLDRAFVVTDWYITAYEPIKDLKGKIVGILYVGILEKPYMVMKRNIFILILFLIIITSIFGYWLSYMLTQTIDISLRRVVVTSKEIAEGNLHSKIEAKSSVKELNDLAEAFNHMSERLVERDKKIALTTDELEVMNKRYLDLIGFVSHELKGILASVVLNVYMFQKRILGDINEKQEKVLRSVARNLDYLTVTVKNFLNLSRIEKDELTASMQDVSLKEHVFNPAIESFNQQAEEREITITNQLRENVIIHADASLLQIIANNLISNAIKYGSIKGKIIVSDKDKKDLVEVEVYNDGEPIASVDQDKLFKKFSRIIYRGQEKIKGTGIGLFITKEIVEKHGGKIWVEPGLRGNSFKFTLRKNKA